MFPELAPGQCDGWEAVDSRPECSARRSARMRASRTKLAMSSTNPPARAGIRDEKEPARDDEREWNQPGRSFRKNASRVQTRRPGSQCPAGTAADSAPEGPAPRSPLPVRWHMSCEPAAGEAAVPCGRDSQPCLITHIEVLH